VPGQQEMQSGAEKPTRRTGRITRAGIFTYDLLVLALLVILGAWYIEFPRTFTLDNELYNLTIESMWFGSLGGVIISLKGVYDHSDAADPWQGSYNLWHVGRPISGAIAGLMTVVLLKAINANGELTRPAVYAAAFILGTQERRFFNFLYEVARLIVQVPEEAKTGLSVTDIQPTKGSPGGVIVISGQGIDSGTVVKLGSSAVQNLVISRDGATAAGKIPEQATGASTVDVTVSNSGNSVVLEGRFTYTAQ
jgi:hypothetical protein